MMWIYRVVKKLTEQELQTIKKRMNSADSGIWIADHKKWPGNSNLQYWVVSTELDGDGLCACVDIEDAEFIAHARQDVPKLVAEVERLQTKHGVLNVFLQQRKTDGWGEHVVDVAMKHIENVEEENKRLREALEFYGDRKNYGKEEVRNGLWVHNSAMGITFSNIHHDDGETARKALEGDDNDTT